MTKEKVLGECYLKNVRLSYPHLDKPSASVKGGAEKYRASFIIDPSTPEGKKALAAAKAAAGEVVKETWPKAAKAPVKADRNMLKRGDDIISNRTGEVPEELAGMIVVNSNADDQPLMIHRNKKRLKPEEVRRVFYGGCYVEAALRFYTISDPDKGGNGLFCSLEAIRFWEDGESFGRAGVNEDFFDDDDEEGGSAFDDDDDDDGLI